MFDPRDPLGLEDITEAARRLGAIRLDLAAFYPFTGALAAIAILLAMLR